MTAELILATDLDGTLAGGTGAARDELLAALGGMGDVRLVYVTGRSPDSARELVLRSGLPEPHVLIADVGTSVLHGLGPEPVSEIVAQLDARWPGAERVRERLRSVPGLTEQEVRAPRRVSYWVEAVRSRRAAAAHAQADPFAARSPDDASYDAEAQRTARETAAAAATALAPLEVDVLLSANVFLDVLPRGVDKGSTLGRVLQWLDAGAEHCVVAGDSLNDLSLFETGLRGIVVGNCEPALRQRIAHLTQIYQAGGEGAAGILEGLRHFGYAGGGGEDGDGK